MTSNEKAVQLIKEAEGCSLTPYLCPAGVVTIGYGHVLRNHRNKSFAGERGLAKARALFPAGITQQEAETVLHADIKRVETVIANAVHVPLTDNQRAALVSFVFHVGEGHFRRSTLLRKLNAGDYAGAAEEFPR